VPTVVEGAATLRLRANREIAGKCIRDNSEAYLRRCVDGALSEAGLGIGDVDFLICNTPTAWYAEFCVSVLGLCRIWYLQPVTGPDLGKNRLPLPNYSRSQGQENWCAWPPLFDDDLGGNAG
jgi:hypothetical protein